MEAPCLDGNRADGNLLDVNLKEFIKSNTEWLSEHLDPDFGLLDDLLRNQMLSKKEISQVKCLPESFARSEKLLNIVLEKGVQEKFIEALRNTKQTHLANFIVAKGERMSMFGADWPLTDQEIQTLDTNHGALVDLIDACDLLSMLYSRNVINKRQMDAIASKSASHEKNDLLLDIMRRKSLNDYRLMIDCLRVTKQSHIAQILNDGEVIFALHAQLKTLDIDKIEEEIVSVLTNILSIKTSEDFARLLEQAKLRLIAVKRGHSVILYIHIKNLEELLCIKEDIASGKLTTHITALFNHLLSRPSIIKLNNLYLDLSEDAFKKATQLLSVKGQKQLEDQSEAEEQENTTKNQSDTNDLPLELIDIILQSAVQLHMMSKESQIRPTDFIRKLLSVDQCWFQRITRRRLKKTIWGRLPALFKRNKRKSTVIRSNEAYLVENIQTEKQSIKFEMAQPMHSVRTNLSDNIHNNKLLRTLRMADSLTDVQTRLIKSVKRNITKNATLLHVIRSFDDKRYNGLVQCLRECNLKFATRVVDMGGVVVKLQLESDRTATKEATKQILLQKLNDLRDKMKPRSEQTEKLLLQLNDEKMVILNSVNDRQTVVWIWCQSKEALQKLQTMTEDNALQDFFSSLLESISLTKEQQLVRVALKMNDGINEPVSINIDKDQLKKQVVDYKLAVSACMPLDIRQNRALGVAKLKDKIFVLNYPNGILVFEDRSPFELKEEIEAKELKDPSDIVSSEKENCLYVICCNSSLWKFADDHKAIPLGHGLVGGPFTISVSGGGHLVKGKNGTPISSLEIYGPDGERLLAYRLPFGFRKPIHAVETSTGNYIMLHEWLSPTRRYWMWMVSELAVINGELQPTRRFVPKNKVVKEDGMLTNQEMEGPRYLSLDSDDRVFVAQDENTVVILLDSDLNWVQMLRTPDKREIPWPKRMCYDKENKELIVVVNRGAGVNVYTLSSR